MITLEEIAGRLIDKKDYDFTVTKESTAKGAETKLRNKLSKVLTFIDNVEHKRFKTGCTIIPISVTNKDNLSIWENEKGISRTIAFMIEIGLISIESDRYQFRAYYEKDNKRKYYRYYKENEDNVKQYCKDHNIQAFI